MSDLMQVLFARGQNEGVDPRVAPPDVHVIAQNVRWRKDGRPAKRYGLTALSTTGLNSISGVGTPYTSEPVNAITQWAGAPLFALGSGVRQFSNGFWTDADTASASEMSHWGPGFRSPIARGELSALGNASVGYSGGELLYVWDDGTNLYGSVRSVSGSIIIDDTLLGAGTYPRCVSTTNFIYFLWRSGTTLNCTTFNPATSTAGATVAVGALASSSSMYDGVGRGSDFVIAYQSGANTITTKLLTAVASPVTTQTQAATMAASVTAKIAIASTSTSSVFVAWLEPGAGKVLYFAYNHGLTAGTIGGGSPVVVQTFAFNTDQPGMVIDDANHAGLFWGGLDTSGSTPTGYVFNADVSDAGSFSIISSASFFRMASKPFNGPLFATGGVQDGRYVWVHTHNSDSTNSNAKWDDQRTHYLMQLRRDSSAHTFRRQMHTPNMVASSSPYTAHLSDVVDTGSGFFSALSNTTRFGNSKTELFGIDSVSYRSIFESQLCAARDVRNVGRVAQFSGGALSEFSGSLEETGFTNFPLITGIAAAAGAGLTASSMYSYRAVFEWIDAQGRRHRSAPSDPVSYTTPGATNLQASVSFGWLTSSSRSGAPTTHIYRTLAGGTTYHRITPNVGAPNALSVSVYVDVMTDADAAVNEFLYTDGGVVPNGLPPPCTFMAFVNGRLWLGGQLDRNIITASKLLVDGEPTQFSDAPEFEVFLSEECTGLAGLDGTTVLFARESIYLVNGDGPNDQAIGSFSPPQKLPSEIGCIDWRSVLETSLGVFFQSKRGIYLLPRGFNTPIFIGAEVEDTLSLVPVCQSATLVAVPASPGKLGEITARFVMANADPASMSVVLIFDFRTQGWSVDVQSNTVAFGPGGMWNDTWFQSKTDHGHLNSLWAESNSGFGDDGNFITTTLGTGDIRPFGVGGYGGFDSLLVLGEYRGNSFVNVLVSVDGTAADTYTFAVNNADAADGSVWLDVTPKTRLGSSIRVTIQDTADSPSEGFIAQALFLEHETIGKTKRLAAGRKA